jgi:hypothetical protein
MSFLIGWDVRVSLDWEDYIITRDKQILNSIDRLIWAESIVCDDVDRRASLGVFLRKYRENYKWGLILSEEYDPVSEFMNPGSIVDFCWGYNRMRILPVSKSDLRSDLSQMLSAAFQARSARNPDPRLDCRIVGWTRRQTSKTISWLWVGTGPKSRMHSLSTDIAGTIRIENRTMTIFSIGRIEEQRDEDYLSP